MGLGFEEGLALVLEFQEGLEPRGVFISEEFSPFIAGVFKGRGEVEALLRGNPLHGEGDGRTMEVAGKLHFFQESGEEGGIAWVGEEDGLIGEGGALKLIGEGSLDGEDFIALASDEGGTGEAGELAADDDQVIEVSRRHIDEGRAQTCSA